MNVDARSSAAATATPAATTETAATATAIAAMSAVSLPDQDRRRDGGGNGDEVVDETHTPAQPRPHGSAVLATPTATPTTESAALLRDWAPHPHMHNINDGSASSQSQPPVAPAVVLNERSSEHRASSGSRYNYPVATFVSNLVRTSVNEIRDHIYASAVPANGNTAAVSSSSAVAPGERDSDDDPLLSIRSAPPPIATATFGSGVRSLHQLFSMDDIHVNNNAHTHTHTHVHTHGLHHSRVASDHFQVHTNRNTHAVTVGTSQHHLGDATSSQAGQTATTLRGGSNDDPNSTEFLLIDGDLVAVSAANHAGLDDDDGGGYYSRRRLHSDDEAEIDGDVDNSHNGLPPGCRHRTSRVRRGVKGIKKWIKKIKRKKDKHQQQSQTTTDQQQQQQQQQQQVRQNIFDSLRRRPNSSTAPESSFSEALTTTSLVESSSAAAAPASASAPFVTTISANSTAAAATGTAGNAAATTAPTTVSVSDTSSGAFSMHMAALPPNDASIVSNSSQPSLRHVMSERSVDSLALGEFDPAIPPIATTSAGATAIPSRLRGSDQATTPPRHSKPPAKKEGSKRRKRFSFLRDSESRNDVREDAATTTTDDAVNAPATGVDTAAVAGSSQLSGSLVAPAPPPTDGTPPQRQRRGFAHNRCDSLTVDESTSAVAALSTGVASLEAPYDPLAFAASPMPDSNAFGTNQSQRVSSVVGEASFIGNADQLLEAGVLPETTMAADAYIEDRLDDYDKYDKKDEYSYCRSVVPRDADYKVDKQDAPCVDAMLSRAGEFVEDLEQDSMPVAEPMPLKARGKSDGSSIPLSQATSKDVDVHNDTLKLVMVGAPTVNKSGLARAIRGSNKKPRKRKNLGVDVHLWRPPNKQQAQFSIWDVQGASSEAINLDGTNFGAHPGTQSLFFSDKSLYLLVWDLAANNYKATRHTHGSRNDDSSCSSSDDDDDEYEENDYMLEDRNRQADRALRSDIEDRVLSWVDCIARRGSHSAILPVGLVPEGMSPSEAKRRCDLMAQLLVDYTQNFTTGVPPKVLMGAETMMCVSLDTVMGMDMLRETIVEIATDSSHSVFDHVGTPVPKGTVHVMEAAKRMKEQHKLVLVDHLLAELHTIMTVEEVLSSLHFLSYIGELFYYGNGIDDVLSQYVILSRKWLISALSCILRNDLKRELAETRRFMNMQCLYSDQEYPENHVVQAFSSHSSSCPLLSSIDTQMLWHSMSFMRAAVDKTSELQDNSTTAATIFGFLERLLVQSGVFLPLEIDDPFQTNDCVYFVPSLLATADTKEMWTYKSSESWMTTLSHSWLFRDGAPVNLMERVTVSLLHDLYEFSRTVSSRPFEQHQSSAMNEHNRSFNRSNTFPFAQNSFSDFASAHNGEPIGSIKIHQIMCWKSSIMVKIGSVFPDGDALRESFLEVFITIADQTSPYCVASDIMRPTMQRLIVSGKGQVGHHGIKLWKGGYAVVLDSIKASLAKCTNVDRQVVCPECLAHAHPSGASTWSWDSVRAAATSGSSVIRCMRGHRVDANMVCGTCKPVLSEVHGGGHSSSKKAVRDLLPSVVVVALWDADTQTFRNVGSGFVVDRKHGLVVTAGHILFNMVAGQDYGTPYFGLTNTKIAIGLIPKGPSSDENSVGNTALFRYFAEIVASDIHNVDACVLKITTRMENDVVTDVQISEQSERLVDFQNEELSALKMTRRYELEEGVRILGFNQGGEGILEQGKHVNRSADFAKGYICKQFRKLDDHSNSSDESSSSIGEFSPREEIVVMCPTISGHSGGPCVNDEGKVVGILSRADPVDRQRCYLVPVNEIKTLVSIAKQTINRKAASL